MKPKLTLKFVRPLDPFDDYFKCEAFIRNLIVDLFDGLSASDIKLLISIHPFKGELDNTNAYACTKRKWAEIHIDENFLKGPGTLDDVRSTVLHEFIHVLDMVEMRKLGIRFFMGGMIPRNANELCMKYGYDFWTEYLAYYNMIRYFDDKRYYPTFLYVVKEYKQMKEVFSSPLLKVTNDGEVTEEGFEQIDKVKKMLDGYVYNLAKFLAGVVKGSRNDFNHSERTKDDDYYEVYDHICSLSNHVVKYHEGQYSKWTEERLIKLGWCILKNIYGPFGFYPIRNNNKPALGYFPED